MGHQRALLLLCISSILLNTCQAGFYSTFQVVWGGQNIHPDDTTGSVQTSLTADAVGSTFSTWNTHLFGSFKAKIKFVPGNSAGTVFALFLASGAQSFTDKTHDEIDFEFLGNVSGQPYKMQSNLFANGTGGREEQTYLWFDPTEDFHTYQILWNHKLILWLVDDIPIRVYNNIENVAPLSFPSFRPMTITACIFEASTWATEGGQIPIDYSQAPFTVSFKDFVFDACVAQGDNAGSCASNYSSNWWEGTQYQTFNSDWANQMAWFRQHYLHYNYCTDKPRNPTPPVECSYNHALDF